MLTHRVLVFVDSRWRDTIGHALIVKGLRMAGHLVQPSPFTLWQHALELFDPNVVILNHLLGARNQAIADYVKRRGGSVFVVPTEGRPNSYKLSDWFFAQLDDPKLDALMSWYDISKEHGVSDEKVVVTGCPRFDIYNNYRKLIDRKPLFRDKYRLGDKVVGVTTSFPQSKFVYASAPFNRHDWQDLRLVDVLGDPDEFAKEEFNSRALFRSFIEEAARKLPDYTFVVKPHPMEDVSYWADWPKVVLQDFAHNFINGVDILVARRGCVTVQEGWLLGKPVIQVETGSSIEHTDGPASEGWKIGDNRVKSANGLIKRIRSPEVLRDGPQIDYLRKYGYLASFAGTKVAAEINRRLAAMIRPKAVESEKLAKWTHLVIKHDEEHLYPNPGQQHLGKESIVQEVNDWASIL